jgi:hypothetical protein
MIANSQKRFESQEERGQSIITEAQECFFGYVEPFFEDNATREAILSRVWKCSDRSLVDEFVASGKQWKRDNPDGGRQSTDSQSTVSSGSTKRRRSSGDSCSQKKLRAKVVHPAGHIDSSPPMS